MKEVASTLKTTLKTTHKATIRISRAHPHHIGIDDTLACAVCGRSLAEAMERLKRLPWVGRLV